MNRNLGVLAVALLLALLTTVKLFAITAASPLIAYPNNWDFARVESCMGLWQDYGDPSIEAHLSGPVNRLVLTRKTDADMCAVSIDTVVPYLVTRFFHTGDIVDFRYIGMLRACMVLVAAIAVFLAARTANQRLVVSGIYALAFGEFGYLAYMNTLYNEFIVVLGSFLAVAALWLLWVNGNGRSKALQRLTFAALLCLGLSKPQYAPLALVVGLVAAVLMFRNGERLRNCVSVVCFSLVLVFLFSLANYSDSGFGKRLKLVNITDTIFTEVLPNAEDPESALRDLRLPQSCMSMIGKSFYSPGVDQHHPCPDVINVKRTRLIPLFFKQPSVFFGPIKDGIAYLKPFPGTRYGFFEAPPSSHSVRYYVTRATSLGTYLNKIPDDVFHAIIVFSLSAWIPVGLWCLAAVVTGRRSRFGGDLLFAAGGFIIFYSLLSSVFGDGSSEVPKHAFLWCFGTGIEGVAIITIVIELATYIRTATAGDKLNRAMS
ncbi:MAG: hypothetical protein WCA85_06660 [Paraburkholderia sp.]|uniref:glycan biosynthesis hexose transferase WsfD n=1 Tax=Paraburkholderia sp. TaxID=1926495 RepID=UPI003C4B3C8A